MPNVIAHCWYGEVIATKTPAEIISRAIKKNHEIFMLGAQGPDPFYFYHRMPWQSHKKNEYVYNYAEIIHEKHINKTFTHFITQAKASNDDRLIAYVAGFLCHWALDMKCHPYINYETGSLTRNMGNMHQVFETQIDKGIMVMNNMSTRDFQTRKLVKIPKGAYDMIYDLFKPLFKQMDNLDLDYKEMMDSFPVFVQMQGVFYDPNFKKFKWMSRIEKLFGMAGLGTGMMVPAEYDEEMDAMNHKKRLWQDPCTGELHNESFHELATMAVGLALNCLDEFENYLEGKGDVSAIIELIGDRDFSTGLGPGARKKYFKADAQ